MFQGDATLAEYLRLVVYDFRCVINCPHPHPERFPIWDVSHDFSWMLVFIWSSWDFKRILPGEFRGQSSTAERFGTWLHSAYIGAERSRNWIAERTNHNLLFSQIDSREKTSAFRPRHKHAEHRKPWISQRRLQSCSLWSICVNWVTREKVSPHRVILFWC